MEQPTKVMGILNVTPDSFSDGGSYVSEEQIHDQVRLMVEQGADIIDVGGESTRPYSAPVTLEEELARVIPAIKIIREQTDLPISVDTTKAKVARQCLLLGASIINDISALRMDPAMVEVLKTFDVPIVLMHMQGEPGNMQRDPQYQDVVAEIIAFFKERLAFLQEQGIEPSRAILDPGIGFGKALEHNLAIFRNIGRFQALGFPVLIGHSRKSFLHKLFSIPPEERDCPTAVLSALCAEQGVDILRVHDVARTVQAVKLASFFR
jgi:dihydropteroate synthase